MVKRELITKCNTVWVNTLQRSVVVKLQIFILNLLCRKDMDCNIEQEPITRKIGMVYLNAYSAIKLCFIKSGKCWGKKENCTNRNEEVAGSNCLRNRESYGRTTVEHKAVVIRRIHHTVRLFIQSISKIDVYT